MGRKLSGLKIRNPEFYFNKDDVLWVSRVQFSSNVNIPIAVVGQGERNDRVYGIIQLRSPFRIQDIDDIMGQIPTRMFKQFRDVGEDIWAYPVDVKEKFDQPKKVLDGLKDGQRLWIDDVKFSQHSPHTIGEMSQSDLQRKHDRIHAFCDSNDISDQLFNLHYHLAEEYDEREHLNHTIQDSLDWQYAMFKAKTADEFGPACRKEDEDRSECVSRKISEISEEKPDWSEKRVQATAISMCESPCSDNSDYKPNILLAHLGNWTPEDFQHFDNDLSESEARTAARVANAKFLEFLNDHSIRYAIQLSISAGIARVR